VPDEDRARLDPGAIQMLAEFVARIGLRNENAVHPVGMDYVALRAIQCHRNILQRIRIPIGDRLLFLDDFLGPFNLCDANGRAHVRHPVVVGDFVVPVHSEIDNTLILQLCATSMRGDVAADHHSTFARGNRLVAEEAKRRDVPEGTNVLSFVKGAEGFCAILDQEQPAFRAKRHYRRHVARMSVEVDDHHGARTRRDRLPDRFGSTCQVVASESANTGVAPIARSC
jgi:hypothetical protein